MADVVRTHVKDDPRKIVVYQRDYKGDGRCHGIVYEKKEIPAKSLLDDAPKDSEFQYYVAGYIPTQDGIKRIREEAFAAPIGNKFSAPSFSKLMLENGETVDFYDTKRHYLSLRQQQLDQADYYSEASAVSYAADYVIPVDPKRPAPKTVRGIVTDDIPTREMLENDPDVQADLKRYLGSKILKNRLEMEPPKKKSKTGEKELSFKEKTENDPDFPKNDYLDDIRRRFAYEIVADDGYKKAKVVGFEFVPDDVANAVFYDLKFENEWKGIERARVETKPGEPERIAIYSKQMAKDETARYRGAILEKGHSDYRVVALVPVHANKDEQTHVVQLSTHHKLSTHPLPKPIPLQDMMLFNQGEPAHDAREEEKQRWKGLGPDARVELPKNLVEAYAKQPFYRELKKSQTERYGR